MGSFLRRVFRGAGAMFRGVSIIAKDKEVRRTYRLILVALFLFTLALNAGGILPVLHVTEAAPEATAWTEAGFLLLRILGILVVLLLSPVVAITTCNLFFPVFSEIPFFAGLKSLDPARGVALEAREGLGNASAIANSVRRFALFLLLSSGCFLLGLIPVVGPFLAPPLQFYLTARIVGWEMLDPYFERTRLDWDTQKLVVGRFAPEVLGMGLVCAPLLAIPLVGPLFFGLLQASAAQFVVSILPAGDDASHLLSSGS